MHEFALMESTLQIVEREAKKQGIVQISQIGMEVGQLSGALPDALQFAFSVLKKQMDCLNEDSILDIEYISAKMECSICQHIYYPDERLSLCPKCLVPSGKLICGDELRISYIDGEERKDTHADYHESKRGRQGGKSTGSQ